MSILDEDDEAQVRNPLMPPIPAQEFIAEGLTEVELADGRIVHLYPRIKLRLKEISEAGYSALGRVNRWFLGADRQEGVDRGFGSMLVVGERTPAHQKAYDRLRDHHRLFYPRPAEELIAKGLIKVELADGTTTVRLTPETVFTIGQLSKDSVMKIDLAFGLESLALRWRVAHDTEALEEELGVVISEEKVRSYRNMKIIGKRK